MRSRVSHLWMLAGGFAFVVLLALACQPGQVAISSNGFSAPLSAPAALESGHSAPLAQSPFHWHCATYYRSELLPAVIQVRLANQDWHTVARPAAHYGPLHRRPPPRFS
ncbi:MAG: hypothetical protein ABI693_11425 [Bryobacteraceae bacterium]